MVIWREEEPDQPIEITPPTTNQNQVSCTSNNWAKINDQ